MADEQDNKTPVAPDAGDGKEPAQSTDAPPAAASPDKTTMDNDTIRDPEAWAKSQVEKYQRLQAKAEERAAQLEAQVNQLQTAQQEAIKSEIDQLRQELQAEKQTAAEKMLEAERVKAVVAAGLDAGLAKFITATDADSINEQVQELTGHIPAKPAKAGKAGNPAGDSGTGTAEWVRKNLIGRESPF